jgi:hypothetical protein
MLCLSVFGARNTWAAGPRNVPYCDLLSAPETYDKNSVTTEALIQSSYHEVHVFDSKCRSTATSDRSASIELPTGWNSTKAGKKLSKLLRHDRTARVAFESVFYGSGGPYGPERTRFRFVMQRLLSAEEVPKK